jgi:hypothetical protein
VPLRLRVTLEKKERKSARNKSLAKFQFYIDENAKRLFEGITINISPDGFGFLTETAVKEGQNITITKHTLPDFTGKKAYIIWVKKGSRYVEAGAKV